MIFNLVKKNKIDGTELLKEISNSKKIQRYFYFVIGILIMAIAFNLFMKEAHIMSGVSGLSLITEQVFGLDPSLVILMANIILVIASFVFLGKEKTTNTIMGSILYPVFVKLTETIPNYIDFTGTETIVLVLSGAVLSGFGTGLIFKNNFTSGGTDILKQILTTYFKMPYSKTTIYSEGIIIVLGAIIFGWTSFLYSIITIFISGYISDRVILGISEYKTMQIITNKEEEIKDFILETLHHGVTIIDAEGGYTKKARKVLISAIPTREYFVATEAIKKIDPESFVIAIDTYEITGKK